MILWFQHRNLHFRVALNTFVIRAICVKVLLGALDKEGRNVLIDSHKPESYTTNCTRNGCQFQRKRS